MPSFNRISELPPIRRLRAARSRQRGQALTEVAFSALLVLIPVFAIGWALYAYGQARTTALNGARYAAWERTVWRANAGPGPVTAVRSTKQIEDFMVERFFAKPEAAIKSQYDTSTKAKNADLPSFYSVHNGDKVVDIEKSASQAQAGEAARPTLTLRDNGTTTSSIGKAYDMVAKAMSALGGEKMRLEDKGLYVAEVRANLNGIRHLQVFDRLNLNITQRAAVLTDAWSAGGRKHEEAIVKPLVPASRLQGLVDLFEPLTTVGLTPFKGFRPGCVKGDIVPKDTLPPGTEQHGEYVPSYWDLFWWSLSDDNGTHTNPWLRGPWETGTPCDD